jgi:hypothetical protein
MARGIIYVETKPASPDREAEYHNWYNDTHLEQILSVEGIVSARRFAPTTGDGPFIAIYELDCDDLDAAARRMSEVDLTGLENISMDPKPVPHVYREIGSLEP